MGVPLDVLAFKIYYFDHPSCGSAEYKGEVLEVTTQANVWKAFGDNLETVDKFMVKFVNDVKTNVSSKYGANIICGGKFTPSMVNYQSGRNNYRFDLNIHRYSYGNKMKTLRTERQIILTDPTRPQSKSFCHAKNENTKLDFDIIGYKYIKIVYTKGM